MLQLISRLDILPAMMSNHSTFFILFSSHIIHLLPIGLEIEMENLILKLTKKKGKEYMGAV